MRFITTTAVTTSCLVAQAQAQNWIRQDGSTEEDTAFAVAPASTGGVFVAGHTYGNLGGPNAGDRDAYLAHYSSSGERHWLLQFGTTGSDQARALAPDNAGGVYVGGATAGSLAGPNAGNNDVYLTRYDRAGVLLWTRQTGTYGDDQVRALASDGSGGVFVAGYTTGIFGGLPISGEDAFLARYGSAGNLLWLRQFGTSSLDRAWAIASDGTGGLWIAGSTNGSLGGPNAGGYDAFLARYSGTGNQTWIRQLGTPQGDFARGVVSDGAGGAVLVGLTDGSLGGPNAGLGADVFLARYDKSGSHVWTRQFGSGADDDLAGITANGSSGYYVGGYTTRGFGGIAIQGEGDMFLSRHDSDGSLLDVQSLATSQDERAYAVVSIAGGAVIAGETRGSLGGTNAGGFDAVMGLFDAVCYPDCDQTSGAGVLDIFDFLCWQNHFVFGSSYACDCDTSTGNGVCDVFDFLCFQNAFVGGCP